MQGAQRMDTTCSCAVCEIHMYPKPCFQRYHTLRVYHNDEEHKGTKCIKGGGFKHREEHKLYTTEHS